MISINGFKRKSSTDNNNSIITTTTKRFRGTAYDGKIQTNEQSKMITSEYRQLQYELQCQEALLILMQKLKTNQRIVSQTNNTKQRTITPVNTIKSPTKPSSNSTSIKPSSTVQPSASKLSVSLPQATRQTNNGTLPATATRLSSTVPSTTMKNSSLTTSSKNNGITTDQHLLNAKLALRKQLEQTLLQIPTPKPTTCDLPYIPGINGWAEFLTLIGHEQAFNTYTDFLNRRLIPDISINTPNICAQCGTDWSVTWHEVISINESDKEEKIFCDRCRKTSQKKILKQDHSNRLRQAFMKALQQEKELDAKFQQTAVKQQPQPTPPPPPPPPAPAPSSHSKHSNKPLSTKINSNKHTNNNNHHHHSGKSSSSSKTSIPVDAFASTLAALPTNEQIELFQKHFLSNMFPLAFANQAAALSAKSTHQQQQQALAASLPAMAASLMRQGNPAQYLLDMIPQAAKQQQQQQRHHHRHSK